MRRLSEADIGRIVDFAAESGSRLPPYALEKDAHILEAMRAVGRAAERSPFRLVFCGGTCLSKAYGIIDRMSEDVDYKLVAGEDFEALSGAKRREALSSMAKRAVQALEEAGFGPGSVERASRDANAYTRLEVAYESAFAKPAALRPKLLIELNHAPLHLPPARLPVGPLLEQLAFGAYQEPFEVECVDLREALAEKLVSFPRRLSMLLSRQADPEAALMDPARWDPALVRHLYDAKHVLDARPEIGAARSFGRLFEAVVRKDMADFEAQHPEFAQHPAVEISLAMKFAKGSALIAGQFESFVRDMSYAPEGESPSFEECFAAFDGALRQSLANSGLGPKAGKAAAAARGPA